MAIEVKVPVPDQTTEQVRIVEWKKKVGDPVKRGEVVLEIETDKAVMEVESAGDGLLLQQLVAVDDMVPVGQVIGYIGAEGEVVASAAAVSKTPAVQTAKSSAPVIAPAAGVKQDKNITEVKVPVPDQTTEQVRIVEWKKSVGDTIKRGEVVLEIETDKAVMEVESAGDGVLLQQLVVVDDMVPVGQVIGFIGPAGSTVRTAAAPAQQTAAAAATSSTAAVTAAVKLDANVTEVKVPVPDQTTEQVRIVDWKKAVGDSIKRGEVVLEIETDKAVMEIESAGDGVLLQQLVAVDDMVPVGKVIGYIGPQGTTVPTAVAAPAAQAAISAAQPAAAPISTAALGTAPASPLARKIAAKEGINLDTVKGTGPHGKIMRKDLEGVSASLSVHAGRLFASPNAKRLAKELGVDIADVIGTGPNGRITGSDVQVYASQMPATSVHGGRLFASPNAKRLAEELVIDLTAITGSGPNNRIVGADVIAFAEAHPAQAVAAAPGQPVPGTEVELTKMRRAIGINLQNSFRDTPHFNVKMSIDMTRAMQVRGELNKGKEKAEKVSVNDLVVMACTIGLRKYPAVNSKFLEDRIRYEADINVGIATAVEAGLIVPVVINADKLSWKDLAVATKDVVGQARNGKLVGLGKGTFTVSNLGMFGVDDFTAIINPPEAAILAVGGLKETVVAVNGMIGIKPMMTVTLCSDHRVIDGALAAQFLGTLKQYLEEEIEA